MQSTRAHRDVKSLSSGDVLTDDVTGERYRVLSLVGQGGMGRVFKVQQARTGDIFAVKCNQPIDPTNRTLVERVRREGEFLKGLRPHPHIVPVLATGVTEDGVCWMLMPLLDGASVGTLLSVLPRIALVWALEITRAVCSALSAVHQAAIHRDIKPDNVFVTRQGGIYVLDWGAGKFYAVGRLTTTGTTLGTIAYSSPEQLRDPDALDGRSDLFSVGILLFQMLTGHHPFAREGQANEDPITLGYRIIHEQPRALATLAPELPGYVAKVTHKLLEKDRADRSRNAAEAAQVFVAALNELRSRLGDPLPIARLFDAYDATLAAEESERLATQDTERSAAAKEPSGPRAKLGTVPLAAFVAPAHLPELPAPPARSAAGRSRELALRAACEREAGNVRPGRRRHGPDARGGLRGRLRHLHPSQARGARSAARGRHTGDASGLAVRAQRARGEPDLASGRGSRAGGCRRRGLARSPARRRVHRPAPARAPRGGGGSARALRSPRPPRGAAALPASRGAATRARGHARRPQGRAACAAPAARPDRPS